MSKFGKILTKSVKIQQKHNPKCKFEPNVPILLQVGVCALVACYLSMGAFLFSSIETDSQMEQAIYAQQTR